MATRGTTQYYPTVQRHDIPLQKGDFGIVNTNSFAHQGCLVKIREVYMRFDNAWLYAYIVITVASKGNGYVGAMNSLYTHKIDPLPAENRILAKHLLKGE